MAQIENIPTRYNGTDFRSRLEAKWAVFFDAIGIKWEYEPQDFMLDNGKRYLPDFKLKDILISKGIKADLWVEVKGNLTCEDEDKVRRFSGDYDKDFNLQEIHHPTIILGTLKRKANDNGGLEIFPADKQPRVIESYAYIDLKDSWIASFALDKNYNPGIFAMDGESDYRDFCSRDSLYYTVKAYDLAYNARFEHGEEKVLKNKIEEINVIVNIYRNKGEYISRNNDTKSINELISELRGVISKYEDKEVSDIDIEDQERMIGDALNALNNSVFRYQTIEERGYKNHEFASDLLKPIWKDTLTRLRVRYKMATNELLVPFDNDVYYSVSLNNNKCIPVGFETDIIGKDGFTSEVVRLGGRKYGVITDSFYEFLLIDSLNHEWCVCNGYPRVFPASCIFIPNKKDLGDLEEFIKNTKLPSGFEFIINYMECDDDSRFNLEQLLQTNNISYSFRCPKDFYFVHK